MHLTHSGFHLLFSFYDNLDLKCEVEYNENIGQKFLDAIWKKNNDFNQYDFKTPSKIIQTIYLSTLKERELKDTIHFSFDF